MINPFKIEIDNTTLNNIKDRVRNFPWHEMPIDGGWDYGTNLNYMKQISDYWVNQYDWKKHEAAINQFSHFKADTNGINLHYILEKGSSENSKPLLISHGWPGSFFESLHMVEKLAHPERFGGNIEDSFDVILPSLPGFGFSGKPPRPYGPRKMAEVLNSLMVKVLKYDDYMAHGIDWGSAISSWLGYDYPQFCSAIHICFPTMRSVDGPQTPEEYEWEKNCNNNPRVLLNDGYRTQQATKPQTLSYAMMDSPVGLAAWIIEKYHGWSDIQNDDVETAHSKDDMLTNIMIYLLTKTFNTSTWIYYGRREEGGRILGTQEHPKVEVPTAAAVFPKESFPWPPKSYMARLYNIQQWTIMPRGGHFSSLEEPDLLIEDLVKFKRNL